MDIKKLYEDSEKELNSSNSKLIIVENNIKSLVKELKLDPTKDLLEQAKSLAQKCDADKERLEKELETVIAQMKLLSFLLMTKQTLIDRALFQKRRVTQLKAFKEHVDTTVAETVILMDKVLAEQDLLERTTVAVQQAKPLLSASSIKQCENLANSAIQSVFELPYTVEYNVETCRFLLNKGDYYTDLAEAEGGGIVTAISFVFDVYLLVKLGKRRFMTFDEHFTQISSKYFSNFIEFVKQLCNDLGVDILLISHDARIQADMCDRVFVIENGVSKKIEVMEQVNDFVFITDSHITTLSRVRNGDLLDDIAKKLEFVVNYCNVNKAILLHGGDVFDKPTVPDLVKNRIFPILNKLWTKPYFINGNHDTLYNNPEFDYKTSYQTLVSSNLVNDLKTVDLGNVVLTSEVPVITRNKPQIVIFHGFLNQEDGRNTFRFDDIATEDNTFVMLGHDHVEYEMMQYTPKIRIYRPGSFTRGVRVETNLRVPKMVHIKVVDGALKAREVEIQCRAWDEIFSEKESKVSKTVQHASYEDIISQIRDSQAVDLTFEQAMKQVSEPDVFTFALQTLEESKLNNNFKRV